MASYLPGVQDYIPQFQPFQPDYNFLGNVLQNAQSKYDQNYKQLSKTYGTLLNSPMLRTDNIQQRDEFFKMIDGDIKKISGMDLSLQQNVDTANSVFDSFYKNKDMVKDMVYTKEYQNQVQTGENYRNCLDQEKCGGYYSEDAMKALHYKADEFKNASREEAQNMSPGKFTPFINVHEKAVKLAKEAGLNVTQDIDTGKWIIKKKNGELVQGGLYSLFGNTIGSDPKVQEMYNTAAYVKRKDFSKGNANQFGGEEQAERYYMEKIIGAADKNVTQEQTTVNDSYDNMSARQAQLLEKAKTTGLTDDERDALQEIQAMLPEISNAQNNLSTIKNSINRTGDDINILRSRSDSAAAHILANDDFKAAAMTLSLKDAEITMTANPYALQANASNLALRNSLTTAEVYQKNALERLRVKANLDIDLKQFEYNLKTGAIGVGQQSEPSTISNASWSTASATNFGENPELIYKKNTEQLQAKQQTATNMQLDFLADIYKTAKAAKTVGANQLLNNILPKGETVQSFTEKLKTNPELLDKVYKTALQGIDPKNKTWDTSWATLLVNDQSIQRKITDINNKKDALVAFTNKVSKVNQNIVNKMKESVTSPGITDADLKNAPDWVKGVYSEFDLFNAKNAKEVADIKAGKYNKDVEARRGNSVNKKYYEDADLLLKNNLIQDEESFIKDYMTKHSQDKYYAEAMHNLPSGIGKALFIKEAQDKYSALTEKFHNLYLKEGVSLNQGYQLSGQGEVHANPLVYNAVDASKFQSPEMVNTAQDFETFNKNKAGTGAILNFGVGDPTAENKGTISNELGVKLMSAINRDLHTHYKDTSMDRPIFSYMMSPVAANDPNVGARTMHLSPQYLKTLVGTKTNAGIISPEESQVLANGFTIYYNKDEVKLRSDEESENTDFDILAKYGDGIKYNIPNSGDITVTKDENNNEYNILGNIIYYDKGHKVTQPWTTEFSPYTKTEIVAQTIQNFLLENHKANLLIDQKAESLNKLGYYMPGYSAPTDLIGGTEGGAKQLQK